MSTGCFFFMNTTHYSTSEVYKICNMHNYYEIERIIKHFLTWEIRSPNELPTLHQRKIYSYQIGYTVPLSIAQGTWRVQVAILKMC